MKALPFISTVVVLGEPEVVEESKVVGEIGEGRLEKAGMPVGVSPTRPGVGRGSSIGDVKILLNVTGDDCAVPGVAEIPAGDDPVAPAAVPGVPAAVPGSPAPVPGVPAPVSKVPAPVPGVPAPVDVELPAGAPVVPEVCPVTAAYLAAAAEAATAAASADPAGEVTIRQQL